MPYQFVGCCFTHFPVDFMINKFDLSNWNYNDKSDLSPFILPNSSIAAIEDEYNLSPHTRIQHQVGIIEKVKRN